MRSAQVGLRRTPAVTRVNNEWPQGPRDALTVDSCSTRSWAFAWPNAAASRNRCNILRWKTQFRKHGLKTRCVFGIPLMRLRRLDQVVAQRRKHASLEGLSEHGLGTVVV